MTLIVCGINIQSTSTKKISSSIPKQLCAYLDHFGVSHLPLLHLSIHSEKTVHVPFLTTKAI